MEWVVIIHSFDYFSCVVYLALKVTNTGQALFWFVHLMTSQVYSDVPRTIKMLVPPRNISMRRSKAYYNDLILF